jgi:hypothetical protein
MCACGRRLEIGNTPRKIVRAIAKTIVDEIVGIRIRIANTHVGNSCGHTCENGLAALRGALGCGWLVS